MKTNSLTTLCGLALITFLAVSSTAAELNTLTPEEKAAGWKLLFDGKSTDGWRSFKKTTFPAKGWVVEAGVFCGI